MSTKSDCHVEKSRAGTLGGLNYLVENVYILRSQVPFSCICRKV